MMRHRIGEKRDINHKKMPSENLKAFFYDRNLIRSIRIWKNRNPGR